MSFEPDWVSPPGDTIKDCIKGVITLEMFAKEMGLSQRSAVNLLKGKYPISKEIAKKLSATLGASKEFWINREATYVEGMKRLGLVR